MQQKNGEAIVNETESTFHLHTFFNHYLFSKN